MRQVIELFDINDNFDTQNYFLKYGLIVSEIKIINLDEITITFKDGDIVYWSKATDLIRIDCVPSSGEILKQAICGMFLPTYTHIRPCIRVNYSEVLVYSENNQQYYTHNLSKIYDDLKSAWNNNSDPGFNSNIFLSNGYIYINGINENNRLDLAKVLSQMSPIRIRLKKNELGLLGTVLHINAFLEYIDDEAIIYIDKPPTAPAVAQHNEIVFGEIDEKTSIQEISINGQIIRMQKESALFLELVQKKYKLIDVREEKRDSDNKYTVFIFTDGVKVEFYLDTTMFESLDKDAEEIISDINELLSEGLKGNEVLRSIPITINYSDYFIDAESRQLQTLPTVWTDAMISQLITVLGIELTTEGALQQYLGVLKQLPGVWCYRNILVKLNGETHIDQSSYIFHPDNKNQVCGIIMTNLDASANNDYKSLYINVILNQSRAFLGPTLIYNVLQTPLLDVHLPYLEDILFYFFAHTKDTKLKTHILSKLAAALSVGATEEEILAYIKSRTEVKAYTAQLKAILVFILVCIDVYHVQQHDYGIYNQREMIPYLLQSAKELGIDPSDLEIASLISQPLTYLDVDPVYVPRERHVSINQLPAIVAYESPFYIASAHSYWLKVFDPDNIKLPVTVDGYDEEFQSYTFPDQRSYQLLVYLETTLKFGRYIEAHDFLTKNEGSSLELLNYLYISQRSNINYLNVLPLSYLALTEQWERLIKERYGCQPWEISETILGSKNHYYLATPAFFDQEFWSIDTQAFTSQAQGELSQISDSLEENLWQILESAIPGVKNRVTQSKKLKNAQAVRSSALGQKAGVILQGIKEQIRDHLLKLRSLTKEERTLLSLLGRVERHVDALSQVYSNEKITLAELKLFINAALKHIPYLVPANVKAILHEDNLDDNQELYFPLVSLFTQSPGILTILEELMLDEEGQVLVFFLISNALLQIGPSRRGRVNKNHMILNPIKLVKGPTLQDIFLLINELRSNCLNNDPEFHLEICKLISNQPYNTSSSLLLNFMEELFIPGIGDIFLPKFLLLPRNHELLAQYLELVRSSGMVNNKREFEYRSTLMETQQEPTLLYGILDQDPNNLVKTGILSINLKKSKEYSSQRIYAVQDYLVPKDNALSIHIPSNTKVFKLPEGFKVLALIDPSSVGASTCYYQQASSNVIRLVNPNNLVLKLVLQDTREHLSERVRIIREESHQHTPGFIPQPLLLNSEGRTGIAEIDYLILQGVKIREEIRSRISDGELTPDFLEQIIKKIKELTDYLFTILSRKHFYGIDPINQDGYDFIKYRNGKDNRQLWVIALATQESWEFNCVTAEMICSSYIQSVIGLQTGKASVQILKKQDNALLLKSGHTYTVLGLGLGYTLEIDLTLGKYRDVHTQQVIENALAPQIDEGVLAEISKVKEGIESQSNGSEGPLKLEREKINYRYNSLQIANLSKVINTLIKKLNLAEQENAIILEPLEEQIIALLTKYLPLTIESSIVFNFLYFYAGTEFSLDTDDEQYALDPVNKQVLIKVFKIPRQIIDEPNGERNAQLLVKAAITPNTQLQDTLSGARKFIMPAVNSKYLEIQREIQILIIRLKSILNVIKDIQSKNET